MLGFDEWKSLHGVTHGDSAGHSHAHSHNHGSHEPLDLASTSFRRATSQPSLRRAMSPIHPSSAGDAVDRSVESVLSPDWDDTGLFAPASTMPVPKASTMSASGPSSNPFAPSAMQRVEGTLHRGSGPIARLPKLGK